MNTTVERVKQHREKSLIKHPYVGCYSTSHPHHYVIAENNRGRLSLAHCIHCGYEKVENNVASESVLFIESVQGWV